MSRERAFEYMATFSNAAEWDPAASSAERLDDAPLGVGSAFSLDVKFMGKLLKLRYAIVQYEAPKRVVLQAASEGFTSTDTITVRAREGGSTVTYVAMLTLKGMLMLLAPVISLMFNRAGNAAAAGLRRELSRER